MSNTVIQIENISKQYRLGSVGTGSLMQDAKRWWHLIRGKHDPFMNVGEENDRTSIGKSNYVWALKDINFSVKQGEVIGIVGKNGAGKSTLLKILSRTTAPTTGSIKVKGRMASLLEVGTGFHPELSGRENIFLNGAILGMPKSEILQKFDEIVDFSGIERYIDTPVKRYSSGMYVRLAFAVAAHLEPEILVLDEVLAVGDTEFQKKCLGKMNSVAGEGRTILFVSHNLAAVQQLCPTSVMLKNGQFEMMGSSSEVIRHYLSFGSETIIGKWTLDKSNLHLNPRNDYFNLESFYALDAEEKEITKSLSQFDQFIYIVFEGELENCDSRLSIGFVLRDENNNCLISNKHTDVYPVDKIDLFKGKIKIRVRLNIENLNEGEYYIDYNLGLWGIKMINNGEENRISIKFKIEGLRGDSTYLQKKRDSILSPYLKWEII